MIKTLWISLIFCLFLPAAFADTITAVKNNKVLIEVDSEPLNIGDKVFGTDENGKKKALIKIEKVKGNRAYGVVSKGKAQKGMGVLRGSSAKATNTSERRSRARRSGESKKDSSFSIGALLGLGINNMTVQLADEQGNAVEKLEMSGTGFSAKAMLDYNFTSYLGVRLITGLEKFTVSNTANSAVCDGTNACRTDIMYITFDGWLRYAFLDTETKVWGGVGFGIWMPGSKTTNTLDDTSIASTSALYLGAGVDYGINEDMFLPIQAEYVILPGSTQVSASVIAIRAGIGYRF